MGGEHCSTNQILYNVTERGVEFDLLPLLKARRIPTMAYSPLGQGDLPASESLASIARRLDATPFQVALAWVLRDPTVIAIPKASSRAHVEANHRALQLQLTPDDLIAIDRDFRPPTRKSRLAML